MAYEVIARKWRPQQFSDVVGQDHVVQTLRNAIATERLAHAYLFVGPRGTGKTSLARILAKAMNCETGLTSTPCDQCDLCTEIMAGASLDVREIDGASNNSVDQVRELRETVRYAPARGRFKIIIIDEVHMLSTAAFNALLKTLEEPPAHVKFMFATTEPQKIPATIISRCQRFDLRRIPVPQIVERLALVAKDEQVTIDEEALLAVARGAEGGLRDAESALDQLISFKGKTITEEDVLSVFGLVSHGALLGLAGAILSGNMAEVIAQVNALDQAGKDLQRLVLELMDHFRNLLVAMHVGDEAGQDLTDGQAAALREQAGQAETGRVLRVCDILAQTEERMRYSLSKRILLETALVRAARATQVVTLDEILARLNGGAEPLPAATPPASAPPPPAPRVPSPPAPPVPSAPAAPTVDGDADLERLQGSWKQVVSTAGRIAVTVTDLLGECRPLEVRGEHVRIGIPAERGAHRDLFDAPRARKAVDRALSDILKRNVVAVFEVCPDVPGAAPPAAPPAEPAPERPVAEASAPPPPEGGQLSPHEARARPEVQGILDAFNGAIIDVKD